MKKNRKPNLERLYMMHSLRQALKIARDVLADVSSYATVLPETDQKRLSKATGAIVDLHMRSHEVISEEHSELFEAGHTEEPEAAK